MNNVFGAFNLESALLSHGACLNVNSPIPFDSAISHYLDLNIHKLPDAFKDVRSFVRLQSSVQFSGK